MGWSSTPLITSEGTGNTNPADYTGVTFIAVLATSNVGGTPTDNYGNIYSPLTDQNLASGFTQLFFCVNPLVGTGFVISATGSFSSFTGLVAGGWTGQASSPFDQENGFSGGFSTTTYTSVQPGSVTPGQNNELILVGVGTSTNANSNFTVNDSFAPVGEIDSTPGVTYGSYLAYLVQGSASAVNPTVSWTTMSGAGAVIATFEAGSSPPPPTFTLTAGEATFSFTGENAGLTAARKISAGESSYAFTGEGASLIAARKITAGEANYTFTGEPTPLVVTRKIIAGEAAYSFTGESVGLSITFLFSVGEAAFALTGESANLTATRKITAGEAAFSLTGESINVLVGFTLPASEASFSFTGESTGLHHTYVLPANESIFVFTGEPADIIWSGIQSGIVYAGLEVLNQVDADISIFDQVVAEVTAIPMGYHAD